MGIVLDYTSRIAPSALLAAGVTGVCRYISLPQADTAWKRIGKAEYDELVAAGIDVTLNFEYAATDWLGGAGAGRWHGEVAVAAVRSLGYPAGKVVPSSADFNMTRAQWDGAGRAYAQAFAAVVRSAGFRPGVYGPWDVLQWVKDAGLMDAFWQAGMSTSWSSGRNANPWPGAHLRQRGHTTVAGQDTDWNEILIPDWGGDDMLADERAALFELRDRARWMDPRLAATADGSDTYKDATGAVHQAHDVQDRKALAAAVAEVKAAAAAPAPIELTDADRDDIANRVVAKLSALVFKAQ